MAIFGKTVAPAHFERDIWMKNWVMVGLDLASGCAARSRAQIMMIAGVTAIGIFTRSADDPPVGYADERVEHKSK